MPRLCKPVSPFRHFSSSLEVIRLVAIMYVRFPTNEVATEVRIRPRQVHNHFHQERHLVDRQIFKEDRSAALAEWQILAS